MKQGQVKTPIISVIIPTYNRKNLLRKCLEALFNQTYPKEKFEIIVVDDGSTDGTENEIKNLTKQFKNLCYLYQKNQGPATARNLGLKKAKREIIAFTDSDCLPAEDWLEQIEKAFRLNPKALGIEGKTISNFEKEDYFHYRTFNETGGQYWTCNIAYQKKALVDIGGFDESFTFFFEDIDLARRLLRKGKIVFAPMVVVMHPARKYKLSRELLRLYQIKSEFRYFLKHKDYFSQFFSGKSDWQALFLIVFFNHIIFRIKRLKNYWKAFFKAPIPWLKLSLSHLFEIIFVIFMFPIAVLTVKSDKTKWPR